MMSRRRNPNAYLQMIPLIFERLYGVVRVVDIALDQCVFSVQRCLQRIVGLPVRRNESGREEDMKKWLFIKIFYFIFTLLFFCTLGVSDVLGINKCCGVSRPIWLRFSTQYLVALEAYSINMFILFASLHIFRYWVVISILLQIRLLFMV